jgi:hypothetical protein
MNVKRDNICVNYLCKSTGRIFYHQPRVKFAPMLLIEEPLRQDPLRDKVSLAVESWQHEMQHRGKRNRLPQLLTG